MPLSEKLRLQAGRPFVHTLIARILVCLFLIILTSMIYGKKIQSHHSYNGSIDLNNKSIVTKYETANSYRS